MVDLFMAFHSLFNWVFGLWPDSPIAAQLPKAQATRPGVPSGKNGGVTARAFQPFARAGHANVIPPKSLCCFLSIQFEAFRVDRCPDGQSCKHPDNMDQMTDQDGSQSALRIDAATKTCIEEETDKGEGVETNREPQGGEIREEVQKGWCKFNAPIRASSNEKSDKTGDGS